MTDSATPVDPFTGEELFVAQSGEFRRPFTDFLGAEDLDVQAFAAAVQAYAETHPKLEMKLFAGGISDELVIQWRWRR